MKVIAAIDNSAAAGPVLKVAAAVARLFHADVEALHIREDGDEVARAEADAAGVPLRIAHDPTVDAIVEAGRADEVAALVVGARGTPGGRRPAGRTALDVITTVLKPVVVVPPAGLMPLPFSRVLVPLDATLAAGAAVESALRAATRADLEIVVAHVFEESALPMFEEQPQHETEAWVREFLARYCPGIRGRARMEVRVGTPEQEILGVIVEEACDLVAVGWSQDLSPGHASVVRELLRWSQVPVLLLPVPAKVPAGGIEGPVIGGPAGSD
jgi:nucleotide-binding universal stress UspA family protein